MKSIRVKIQNVILLIDGLIKLLPILIGNFIRLQQVNNFIILYLQPISNWQIYTLLKSVVINRVNYGPLVEQSCDRKEYR